MATKTHETPLFPFMGEMLTSEQIVAKLEEQAQKISELEAAVASKPKAGSAGKPVSWKVVAEADYAAEGTPLGILHRTKRENLTAAFSKVGNRLDSAVLADFIHAHTEVLATKDGKSHLDVVTALTTVKAKPRKEKTEGGIVEDKTAEAPELETTED